MPRRNLTDRFCLAAKPRANEVQTDYFDTVVRGLSLRVSRSGRATWSYFYTAKTGKRVRRGLGSYPATSLAAARTRAQETCAEIEAGHDPRPKSAETPRGVCEEYLPASIF
jgi:Arm DNA-binding domain